MKNLNSAMGVGFRVHSMLKKHGIEATLEEINRLSKIVEQSIVFNKKLYEVGTLEGVSLATTVEDLIEIFMLRSEVYGEMGYTSEFPESIKGLDFDEYDVCSAIIYYKKDNIIRGTCRLIFDVSNKKFPIDEKFSLNYLRNQKRKISEGSRFIIKNSKGLKQEFRFLTIDTYRVLSSYNLDMIFVIAEEHLKLYQNFGGFSVEKTFPTYGSLKKKFCITLWRTDKISPFFKRVFLRKRAVA